MREGPDCVCGNLRKATRAVTQLYDEAFRPMRLRATQVALLGACGMLGGTTMSRLAEFTVMDRTTLTRNLRSLERAGLIQVTPGEDRREREVTLTKRGSEIINKAYPLWKEAQARLGKRLGQERMKRLLVDLSAVVEVAQPR